jgi:hypothetical protein
MPVCEGKLQLKPLMSVLSGHGTVAPVCELTTIKSLANADRHPIFLPSSPGVQAHYSTPRFLCMDVR